MQINFNTPSLKPNFKANLNKQDANTQNVLDALYHTDPVLAHSVCLAFEDIPSEDTFSLEKNSTSVKITNNTTGKSANIPNCNAFWDTGKALINFVTFNSDIPKVTNKILNGKTANNSSTYYQDMASKIFKEYHNNESPIEKTLRDKVQRLNNIIKNLKEKTDSINEELRQIDSDKDASYRSFVSNEVFNK